MGVAVKARNEIAILIGSNMRLARRLCGEMSQKDLLREQHDYLLDGERAFTQRDLTRWENGHVRISDSTLRRIGRITGHPLPWFYEEHDEEE